MCYIAEVTYSDFDGSQTFGLVARQSLAWLRSSAFSVQPASAKATPYGVARSQIKDLLLASTAVGGLSDRKSIDLLITSTMTADFIQTAISKSAKRIFTAEFTNAAAYDAIIAEITGVDNPLGLAEVELGKQTYKTYVGYFDPNTSEMNGKVQVTAYTRAEYSAAITALTGSADLKTAFGNGGTAETSEIGTEATWNVRISAKLGTDTFQISLNRDSMTVSGYADDATLAAVDAWADTKPALN